MKVYGYCRVSRCDQEESGLGLADQEAKIRAYCELYGLGLVEIVKETASGKSLDRQGLQAILQALKSGRAEGVIVAKLDRLTRSVKDFGELLEDYFSDRFSLFVVSEQIDTRTAAGRLLLNLLTSVAQWERETIGERTKAALKQKRERGEKTGGHVPFGYDADARGKLTVNENEQKAIARIIELRGQGHTYEAIAGILNRDGILTKQGKLWCKASVFKLYRKVA